MADSASTATEQVDAGTTTVDQGSADSGDQSRTDGGDQGGGNAEAAKWRVKLRETEAERDALTQQVEGLQRQIITGLCDAEGIKADAVFAALGDDGIASLLNDDGAVDADKVGAAVGAARERFGIAEGPRRPAPDRTQGQSGNHDNQVDPSEAWTGAFGPRVQEG